ncbi:HEAT repeat domain-containing protein [Deferrisoma camini]|uniref:HEAT repeat domain-containing protein n=1 Tax=Deferrisoma camini TaxID=1035120 RepID=UPI00046CB65C|nr:HEAT repeat domain-containing protein [Deferrisoma camini]
MEPVASAENRLILPEVRIEAALAGLHRAVAGRQFYPAGHPQLAGILTQGYRAWRDAEEDYRWEDPGLEYRSGGFWFGETPLGARNPAVLGLARLWGRHGLQRLRVHKSCSRDAYEHLVDLLAASPDTLRPQGGLANLWSRSPYAAQLEIVAAHAVAGPDRPRSRQQARAWGQALPPERIPQALADPLLEARWGALGKRGPRERRILDLLMRLSHETDVPRFLELLQEIARFVVDYAEVQRFREAYDVVLFLFREAQGLEALGEEIRRDYLLETIRMLVRGEFLSWLIGRVTGEASEADAEAGAYVLRTLGESAVIPLINALVAEKRRPGRRRLIEILVAVGDPVVPTALRMLEDQRWYVVRNMVTILGGIGSPEALRGVVRASADPDPRVRREAARMLGRADLAETEERIRELLDDPDPSVRLMAISAAAARGSEAMVEALWRLYDRISLRSPHWDLKPAVLRALGRIGHRDSLPRLVRIARKRPWLCRRRRNALRAAALQALGDMGGEEALEVLSAFVDGPEPELRAVARRALAAARDGGSEP